MTRDEVVALFTGLLVQIGIFRTKPAKTL